MESINNWQKLDYISKAIAAVFIPIAIAVLADVVASANKQRDAEVKFVELAVTILTEDPRTDENAKADQEIRGWAVKILDAYSGVPMSKDQAEAVISATALPAIPSSAAATPSATSPADTWGVVMGGSGLLADAQRAVGTIKESLKMDAQIFRRAGSFRSVKVYLDNNEAKQALAQAKTLNPTAYLVNMAKWCPTSTLQGAYYECQLP
ncbi:hypothetical protein [Pseudomonas sp. TUM22785]|uniref:hypothetical protein n=1 Tax=Pseudomonas sp. TUM22785 TaxID=3019098 RepID=UPI0023057CDB|nr:hypothetical protein [Pseudomonas sp. TUM22785]WCD83290.1 hypothetical protein PI990_15065 [Pseudomonas sp. TUM22785]